LDYDDKLFYNIFILLNSGTGFANSISLPDKSNPFNNEKLIDFDDGGGASSSQLSKNPFQVQQSTTNMVNKPKTLKEIVLEQQYSQTNNNVNSFGGNSFGGNQSGIW
jgi:hypothetical protein